MISFIRRRLRHAGVFVVAAIVAWSISFPAIAQPSRASASDEREIARCIRLAARGRPWLEKTLWGLRDQEGGWLGAEVANRNGSHDLGTLQINSWWVPRMAALLAQPEPAIRHWLKHDACFNADAARWIFLSALAATKNYWKAVGVYHSPTTWRQQRYASSVAVHLQKRFGREIFTSAVFARGNER